MEAALVILMLMLFSNRSSAEHSDAGGDRSSAGSGGDHSSGEGASSDRDPLGTAAGVLGAFGSSGGVLGGGAAGGTAAGATATASTATTSHTAGSAAAGSSLATASTGTVVATTNGALAVTNAAGQVVGAVTAGTAAGVGIIVGIVVAFVVAARVVGAQEIDKDWQGYLLSLNPNGRALHEIEDLMVRGILRNRSFSTRTLRDFRLDRTLPGSKLTVQGWRNVYNFIPVPGEAEVFRRVRAVALECLRLRSGHGYRMIKNWNVLTPPADWGMTNAAMFSMYDAALPGVGGLASIPHAAGGGTVAARSVPDSEDVRDPLEAISDEQLTNVQGIVLSEPELQAARLLAIVDAVRVLKWDPRPGIEADRRWYAGEVLRALSWQGEAPPGVTHAGEALELDPAVYGVRRFLWPARLKLREAGWVTE